MQALELAEGAKGALRRWAPCAAVPPLGKVAAHGRRGEQALQRRVCEAAVRTYITQTSNLCLLPLHVAQADPCCTAALTTGTACGDNRAREPGNVF